QREAFEKSLVQTALALSVAVDRELYTHRVMLETLAQSQAFRKQDMEGFYEFATRTAEQHGAFFISLFDSEGRQVFNTLRRPGETLPTPFKDPRAGEQQGDVPPYGDPTYLRRVLETGEANNSDLTYGIVAQRLIFTVNVPVIERGKVRYVLNAAFEPQVMTRLLQQNPEFQGVPAVIFDRRGFIVGRWKDAEKFAGRRVTAWPDISQHELSGVGTGRTLEGVEVHFSFARSSATGWGVNVGVERKALEQAMTDTWQVGGTLAAGGLLLGLLFALSLAARLRASITSLAASAAANQPPRVKGLRTREIAQLEAALAAAAASRRAEAHARESRLVAEAREAESADASRMKDRAIAVLSHELRNPLAPIRSGIELLRLMRRRGDTSMPEQVLDMLDRQSAQLTRLVNDLLDVSRISSGRVSLQRSRIDLRAVAEHALESALPGAQARRQLLVRRLPAAPVIVDGDFARLSQATSNLLDNAVKFTPEEGTITLVVRVAAGMARLAVRDTGRGIDVAQRPALFNALVRLEEPHRSTGGLGLGLSIAKALVDLHGGTIEMRDNPEGRGSEFELSLPLAGADESTAAAGDAASRPARPLRVLLVDDNADAARTLADVLRSDGHETRYAMSGASALELAAELKPDVVLLDIGMPGMDGYELARRLRAMANGAAIRLVAVTGWGRDADRERSREAGFDLHLVKPVDPAELARALAGR
ncbi:MAG: response regulator, partial [Betaproteobacteria bacterium]|nr:response regulator [Betaproteobacteria bacterium]